MLQRPFQEITEEEYGELWKKVADLSSFHRLYNDLLKKLNDLIKKTVLYSIHYRYRLPWMLARPSKGFSLERYFCEQRPEKDKFTSCTNAELKLFIETISKNKATLLTTLANSPLLVPKSESIFFHNVDCQADSFAASMIVPSLFGNFIGQENVDDFIDSVGKAFDSFSAEPYDFLLTFENSFLCRVMREFLLSPFVREYMGEQFTVFFDFFKSSELSNDGVGQFSGYARYQRFFSLFIHEFLPSFSVAPLFLFRLFQRISNKFIPQQIIISVLLNCYIVPVIAFPAIFGVLPKDQIIQPENTHTLSSLRYYINCICKLPMPENLINLPAIQPYERVDSIEVENFIKVIMSPISAEQQQQQQWRVPNIQYLAFNKAALHKFSQIMSADLPDFPKEYNDETVILFEPPDLSSRQILFSHNSTYRLTLDAILASHPNVASVSSSNSRAVLPIINKVDPKKFAKAVEEETNEFINQTIDSKIKLDHLTKIFESTKDSFQRSEQYIIRIIVEQLIEDSSIKSELRKKKTIFMEDSSAFCQFIISQIDSFGIKNSWAAPIIPEIGKYFFSLVMTKFSLLSFLEVHKELHITDELFLDQKKKLLESFDEKGFDEKITTLLKCSTILTSALNTVMKSFLYENPIPSSKEIVQALGTAENIFYFQYGEPPEANQLMPLLAHLFMSNSVPTPLSFGKWISHFFRPIMEKRPDWFKEENLNSLEHYFQFNAWMEDLLPANSPDEN